MKNGLIWVWATGLVFCGIDAGIQLQPLSPPSILILKRKRRRNLKIPEGGESEDGAEDVLEETSEDGEAVDEDAAGEEGSEGDIAEEEDSAEPVEEDTEEESDTSEGEESAEEDTVETEGGTTETEGVRKSTCEVIDPLSTTKYGVCKNILKCDCEDGEYTCNYGIVPNHELFETTCDGLDNDCDGATDEGLVDINASTCPNVGVCSNTVFAFCHMGSGTATLDWLRASSLPRPSVMDWTTTAMEKPMKASRLTPLHARQQGFVQATRNRSAMTAPSSVTTAMRESSTRRRKHAVIRSTTTAMERPMKWNSRTSQRRTVTPPNPNSAPVVRQMESATGA